MKASMERLLMRCLHLILSIPLLALIYEPIQDSSSATIPIRWAFAAIIVISGIWAWNGTLIRKFLKGLSPKILGEQEEVNTMVQ